MESLGIDWKMLLAQMANFVILLFVLKKLLYKPLIKAIDTRNKKIDDALVNSQKIEEKLKKIEEQETLILEKARNKAKMQRDELVALANTEKEKIIEEAKISAKKEIEKGLESLRFAEKEAVKRLTDEYVERIVQGLYQKFEVETKRKDYPLIRNLTKNA